MDFVQIYWIAVEQELIWTTSDFFFAMSLQKRKSLGFHTGKGSQTNPIHLDCGFTAKEMKIFMKSMRAYSSKQPSQTLEYDAVFLSGRIAQALEMDKVLIWLRDGFFAHGALAASYNAHFVAALGRAKAITYPMNFWCAMMLIQGVLPPIKALLFAYKRGVPEIFAAAAYQILCNGGPDHSQLNPADRMYIGSVLSKHIRSGYHSLQTTWRVLNRGAGVLMSPDRDAAKHDHDLCVDFWEYAWEEIDSKCDKPEYALVERYTEFEERLSTSSLASQCRAACWKRAVMAISARRSSLIRSLHHHFDF